MADDAEIKQELNSQTGKLEWKDIQVHFARGIVINVAPYMDLVEVGLHVVKDDKAKIEQWIEEGKISRANEDVARRWTEEQPVFWAVVVPPWLLVQEVQEAD